MQRLLSAAALVLLLGAGCEKNNKPPPPSSGPPMGQETGPTNKGPSTTANANISSAAMEIARGVFEEKCARCHGTDGSGHGPAADALNPRPRNYTDANWQASVTDAEIKKIIVLGGQGVGKSPMMPPNPDLNGHTEVLDALVSIIRQFKK
jgi:mono/diheme cytochrome c family protein